MDSEEIKKGLDSLKTKRSNSFKELQKKSLDDSFEVRETVDERRSKKKRLDKSLFLSDDPYSITLRSKILSCKKYHQQQYQKLKKTLTPKGEKPTHKSVEEFNKLKRTKRGVNKDINNSKVCGSLWCSNCRKYITNWYENKLLRRLDFKLKDEEYTNDDFHHLSGFIGLCDLDYTKLNKMIKNDETVWRRIRRKVNKLPIHRSSFIEVVYEFELVDWLFLRTSESSESQFKKKQIQQLLKHQIDKGEKPSSNKFLFVHFHSITNLNKDEIREVFGKEYFIGNDPLIKTDKESGLYIQSFTKTQSLQKNIEKLTSYPFKDPYRYKHTFRGSDFRNGEYFEDEDLSKLVTIYQKIQKRGWRGLFRSVENQISKEMIKYKNLFPNNHPMWVEDQWFYNLWKKDKVWLQKPFVVDKEGVVYKDGWNPNNFFPNGTVEVDILYRGKVIGKVEDYNSEGLPYLKNVHQYDKNPQIRKRDITLEQLYYPKEFLKLNKFETLKKTNYGFKKEFFDNRSKKDMMKFLKSINISEDLIPKEEVEWRLWITNWEQRSQTLKQLNGIERVQYLKSLKNKDRKNT